MNKTILSCILQRSPIKSLVNIDTKKFGTKFSIDMGAIYFYINLGQRFKAK